jgi:uncharacterized protein YlaN (UPF0358 family)
MMHIPTEKLFMLCEKDASRLQRIRKLQNEILSNCGYHEKMRESQLSALKSAGADKEDINMVIRTYDLREKYGKRLMARFNRLLERLEDEKDELELEI